MYFACIWFEGKLMNWLQITVELQGNPIPNEWPVDLNNWNGLWPLPSPLPLSAGYPHLTPASTCCCSRSTTPRRSWERDCSKPSSMPKGLGCSEAMAATLKEDSFSQSPSFPHIRKNKRKMTNQHKIVQDTRWEKPKINTMVNLKVAHSSSGVCLCQRPDLLEQLHWTSCDLKYVSFPTCECVLNVSFILFYFMYRGLFSPLIFILRLKSVILILDWKTPFFVGKGEGWDYLIIWIVTMTM